MENMFGSFIDYNPIKGTYKSKKVNTVLNAKEFYKGNSYFYKRNSYCF